MGKWNSKNWYFRTLLFISAIPVIDLGEATLKFLTQFSKWEQWRPSEICGQNTLFDRHYLAWFGFADRWRWSLVFCQKDGLNFSVIAIWWLAFALK